MADEEKKFLLRLPPRVFDELRRWAEQDMRSINGQIEWLLRQALRKRLGRDPAGEEDEGKERRRG
jgi:hypothetical protein